MTSLIFRTKVNKAVTKNNLVLLLVLLVAGLLAAVLVQLELFGSGLHHVEEHLGRACSNEQWA